MTLTQALELFTKNVSGRIPTGYWEQNGQFIFNTKAASEEGMTAPAQYVVANNGAVYGTNPMRSNLDISKMNKLPGSSKK